MISPDDIKTIGIDFDGTIVENDFPKVGEEIADAIRTMKDLQRIGKKIILWTCRGGDYLDQAIGWLKSKEFIPDAINNDITLYSLTIPKGPKIWCDLFIDDRNFPPRKISWAEVRAFFKLDDSTSSSSSSSK